MFGNHNHHAQQSGADNSFATHSSNGTDGSAGAQANPALPADDIFSQMSADEPTHSPAAQPASHPSAPQDDAPVDNDLLTIKQAALQQLSPLVGHLEQNPEEKFRTTMMMIQASDDHSLIGSAYEAAKQIEDDKVRAQALLDVVNEINYFTQQLNG